MVWGMSNRADEIRKRIAKRKRDRQFQNPNPTNPTDSFFVSDEERHGQSPFPTINGGNYEKEIHPLFRKEVFIFKILLSACLVLIVAIVFKPEQNTQFEASRHFIQSTMDKEFQFTAITTWYEDRFGKPLALLPVKEGSEVAKSTQNQDDSKEFAILANAKVAESFEINGQGIIIETFSNANVEAAREGNVIYAGKKGDLGKTVIIQHSDGTETWYGHLGSISTLLYSFVEKGSEIGTVTENTDKTKGQYYFAIEKDGHFIDPSQVISFD